MRGIFINQQQIPVNSIKHHSEERKRKISLALQGIKRSEDFKQKLSFNKKGNKNCLGQHRSEETKMKMRLSQLGKHHTEETKKKLSIIHKGKTSSFKGKSHSQITKTKISLAVKGKPKKFPNNSLRIARNNKVGLANKVSLLGKHLSIETKKKLSITQSQIQKNKFAEMNEQQREKYLKNWIKNSRIRISKPQKELFEFLKQIFPEATLEYPVKTFRSVRWCDIAVPTLKLDFEFDGNYWHNNKERDNKRDLELANVGWITFRVDKIILSKLLHQNIKDLEEKIL
jgi:very-short-patch-repair endonuclease